MEINIEQKSNEIPFKDLAEGDLFLLGVDGYASKMYRVYVKIPSISQKANVDLIFDYNANSIGVSSLYYFEDSTRVIPIQTLTVSTNGE